MVEKRPDRVVVSYSQESIVEAADGRLVRCSSRRSVGKPVCGDFVHWSETGADGGVIDAIEPRHGEIARPNFRNALRPIAANVDVLVIVVAVRPSFERDLIDRYLVLAEHLGLEAVVWLGKIDMATEEERERLLAKLEPYGQLGYQRITGSTKTGAGIEALQAALKDKTGILVGQSGVGKSSLVKRLLPDLELRIGALSQASGLGKHTTTETTLYHLPTGGDLIDSPGIRMLRLGHLSAGQIASGFRELRPYLDRCRFSDCKHRSEPGCALREALQAGKIGRERLASYQAIVEAEAGG